MLSLRVLQLTDTHLFAADDATLLGVDTKATLRQVCDYAVKRHGLPDLVLATGDLAHEGEARAYEFFLSLVDEYTHAPVAWIPGNHDSGPVMAGFASVIRGRYQHGPWEFVLLDSHIEGKVPGRLGRDEIRRLSDSLEDSPAQHIVIAVHHHLLPIDAGWLDEQRVADADDLLRIVEADSRVRLLVCGHIHQEVDTHWNGIRVLATPSTCFQFLPRSESFALDVKAPGCRWFEFYEDGTFHTEVTRIEEFELPSAVTKPR